MPISVQKTENGRYSLTVPVYVAEAMGLNKADKVVFSWNGGAWELRKA